MRLSASVAVAVIAAAAVQGTPVLAHTEFKACGSQRGEGAGWYNVRASHVSCKDARTVARRYWNNGGPAHVKVDGITYHCDDEQTGEEESRVRCNASGDRKVRFKVGA
jgi:hypothetical protein